MKENSKQFKRIAYTEPIIRIQWVELEKPIAASVGAGKFSGDILVEDPNPGVNQEYGDGANDIEWL